jgi:NAD(P)-dependent dehydrogenase (short-subunit alcohol dehydrogenase family)
MAKAALNMLTRTCAQEYARHHVYMNSVDPGWVSFQHPHPQQETLRAQGVTPPFDTTDAAARVCDPIFTGVAEGRNRWGKLFKDYREIEW